jgi:hypothetical protein
MLSAIVHGWLKSLRLRLGVRPSPDVIRAQTRERVRRLRARRAGGGTLRAFCPKVREAFARADD